MKISALQIFWMVAVVELGMTLLLTQSPAIAAAKQDAWISFAVAGLSGVVITFIAGKLSLLYPNQTFIEYCQTILGKWLGKLIVIPYFIQLFLSMGVILRQSTEIIQMTLFRNTPLLVLIILMLYLMIYLTYKGGIEGIGRFSEVVGPLIFIVIILTLILSINGMNWRNILPIYADSGWKSILKGSVAPLSFLGEGSLIMMLTCFIQESKKGVNYAIRAVALVSAFITVVTMFVTMVFGGLASRMWYPYFEMVRFISVMEFLQNVEILVIVIWILSVFIKLSTFLFLTSFGVAQFLHLKDGGKVVWFVAFTLIPLSLMYPNIISASIQFPQKIWVPFILPINMISIPLLLLVVGTLRKKMEKKSEMN
jgi:spore germination protein KB